MWGQCLIALRQCSRVDKLRSGKSCVVNNPSFESMRAAMIVSQLRTTGVNDPKILAAMGSVPREDFVEAGRRAVAYADLAAPVGQGRALLPPEVLGQLLERAALTGNEKALVIGGATGYRSEEHTSELQSLMRISYAVFCLKKKKQDETT